MVGSDVAECWHLKTVPSLNGIRSSRALQITEASARGQRVGVARLSRQAHNPETGGSNPPLATKKICK